MAVYKDNFHVRFLDVTPQNILKLSALANYFQEIAGEHSSQAGFGLYNISNIGFTWILLGWSIKINRLPKWNDIVQVVTWHKGGNELFSYRDFKAYVDSELIAVASSKWVACNATSGTISKIPQEFLSQFQAESKNALECDFKKIAEPKKIDRQFPYTILRHDIDTNNHMNNIKYITLALEALPDNIYHTSIKYIEVMYKNAAALNEEIVCLYSEINQNEHIVTIKSKDLTRLHAIVKLLI